jgi:hypothetical protein
MLAAQRRQSMPQRDRRPLNGLEGVEMDDVLVPTADRAASGDVIRSGSAWGRRRRASTSAHYAVKVAIADQDW